MANDETYSDEQREEVRARLQRFQDEQKAINHQIRILKGRYSYQIYQIRESIMKFLDKETGTLSERTRTLFKEQGITIVSILTALGMTIGVLIEALLGGPSTTSTPTSQSTTTSNKKGGAREWIKNKLKALSQSLGKLADKALAPLPGSIGSIISWILNRAKEVIGWLSQNLWALITGVGVLIYTYFMTNRRWLLEHPPYFKDSCSSQYHSNLFFFIGDLICIRFLNILIALSNLMLGLTSCLCSLLGSMLGLVITFGLTSGSVFTISTSLDLTSRLIFKLVPILKLGDDISILLL